MEVHKVPRAIIGVPRKLWKHHPLAVAQNRAEKPSPAKRRVARAVADRPTMVARAIMPPARGRTKNVR